MKCIETAAPARSRKSAARRPVLWAAALAGLSAAAAPVHAAKFSEAEIFLELNDTDGDLGIHASIDGGPYAWLKVEDPGGRTILSIAASGPLAQQGLTQLFLESAEPPFDELAPSVFFARFPEGSYGIEAGGPGGKNGNPAFKGKAKLSHVLAAPVDGVMVNGQDAAEDCDAAELPTVSAPITIVWNPVTESHPQIGKQGPVEIARYQFFVEQGDLKFGVDLPPTQTEFQVPAEIIAQGDTGAPFKYEIIARTSAGNNTAIETCFRVED